jgi:hypothetical protein
MYAKSIIDYARQRLASGVWTRHLSIVPSIAPVVMALAVATLPFTLESRLGTSSASAVPGSDALAVESAESHLLKTAAAASARMALPDDHRYAVVAEYMARKYYVSRQVVHELVKTAHAAGRQYSVDPMLLVAVIAVESSFNPIAESIAGAKGLMQIIPQYHLEKFTEFGGEQAVFEPRANIAIGAKILREYLQASSGNLFTALQTYAGALPDHDASYTHKVLNEKDRLDAIMGLPKTDRGGHAVHAPEVTPAAGGRVQMTIPANPATPGAAGKPAASVPAPTTKPAEPSASLPATLAALRLE